MNQTNDFLEPVWQQYAAIGAASVGLVLYCALGVAAMIIVIGRNIIPSLMFSLCCCCKKKKPQPYSKSSPQSFCNKQENIVISLFFVCFVLNILYRMWMFATNIAGYATRIATSESFEGLVVYVVTNVFFYGGFGVFLCYYCTYVILLCNIASVWFHLIDFGGKWKLKLFQSVIGTIVALCFLIGGVLWYSHCSSSLLETI